MKVDYKRYRGSLKELSKDDFGNSLIESETEVYNFDKITEVLADEYRAKKPHCSCDALHIKDDDHIYLIEFKNVKSSQVPKKALQYKAYDSIMTLQCTFCPDLSLENLKEKVYFVFVCNNESGAEEMSNDMFEKLKSKMKEFTSGNHPILYGLEKYKEIFYKDIYTIDKKQFNNDVYSMIFE